MTPVVRAAAPAEIPELHRIYQSVRTEVFGDGPIDEAAFGAATEGEELYVAEVEGHIAGFLGFWRADAFVHHLYVLAEHRGLGAGEALIAHVRASTVRPLRLKCEWRNAQALAWYRRHGWSDVEEGIAPDGEQYTVLELPPSA